MKGKPSIVIMEAITEEEEQRIDKAPKYYGEIRHVRSDNYIIHAKDIYLYGEVDFSNKEDIKNIERFKLIDDDYNACNWIYTNFDFDKGCFTTIDEVAKGAPTWNALRWFMYNYVLIGKPQRVIVYKCPVVMKKK